MSIVPPNLLWYVASSSPWRMSNRRVALGGGVLRREFKGMAMENQPDMSTLRDGGLLCGQQVADAALAGGDQFRQLRLGEGRLLAAALQFDEFPRRIHHQVHVHRRRHIL